VSATSSGTASGGSGALGGTWRAAARIDRSRLAIRGAFTGAIAYAAPLTAGLATGRTREGVTASAGALIVGYADVGRRDRRQARTLLGTAGCVSVAALLGGVTQPSLVATVVVVAVWAFLAGLSVSLGPRIALVGTLATWSLLLAGDLRLHGQPVLRGPALIAAGAVLQAAVTLLVSARHGPRAAHSKWPNARTARERLCRSPADVARAVRRVHPQPLAVRHAVRLAIALVVAVLLYRTLSLSSGYWVPLTVLFLVRPDYHTTAVRALGRALGTLSGAALAWLMITMSGGSDPACLALMLASVAAAFLLYRANYALSTIALTTVIALVVQLGGGSPIGALLERVTDVSVGTLIALGVFLICPATRSPAGLRRQPVRTGRPQVS
jgi:uncharacterized membrane protein YccC